MTIFSQSKIWCLAFLFILLSACSPMIKQDNLSEVSLDLDEILVEGELLEINASGMRIRQNDNQELELTLSAQTKYWDDIEWMMKTPAEVGDWIQAFGSWAKEKNTFEVDRYYANRVDLQGIVYYVCGETEAFMLDQPDQDFIILPLPQKTELRAETPTDPTSYKYFDLMPNFGEELQVVGREIDEPFLLAVVMTRMD